MSVKELKAILDGRGIDYSMVVEKDELKKLVEESAHLGTSQARQRSRSGAASSSQQQCSSSSGSSQKKSNPGLENFLKLAAAAEVLGVSLDAQDEVLAASHKALLKKHHPDRNRGAQKDEHERKFKEVGAAYELLAATSHVQRLSTLRAAERYRENQRVRRQRTEQAGAMLEAQQQLQLQQQQQQQLQLQQQQLQQQYQLQRQQTAAMVEQANGQMMSQADGHHRRGSRRRGQQQEGQAHVGGGAAGHAIPAAASAMGGGPDAPPITVNVQVNVAAPSDQLEREATRAALDQLAREASKRPEQPQFQDILAAAARESASRRAPRASEMDRDGTNPPPPPDPQQMAEMPLFLACEEATILCAKCYLLAGAIVSRTARCICECGGLLRIPDKELERWGWRDGEQPARYRGDLGDRDMAERAMRKRARALAKARSNGTMPQPIVV